jgi:hypothetical protein
MDRPSAVTRVSLRHQFEAGSYVRNEFHLSEASKPISTLINLETGSRPLHVLGEINVDGANLHVDAPSATITPLAHSMAGAGVVHHIIRGDSRRPRSLYAFLDKRTLSNAARDHSS